MVSQSLVQTDLTDLRKMALVIKLTNLLAHVATPAEVKLVAAILRAKHRNEAQEQRNHELETIIAAMQRKET